MIGEGGKHRLGRWKVSGTRRAGDTGAVGPSSTISVPPGLPWIRRDACAPAMATCAVGQPVIASRSTLPLTDW